MAKEIEIIPCEERFILKAQLENMVSDGWVIKGMYTINNAQPESFIILQRESQDTVPLERTQQFGTEDYTQPEPVKKEISISIG